MLFRMEIIDNVNKTLKDDMLVTLRSVSIPLAELNLDAVWQNMVAAIGEMEVADGNTLTEQIQADD